MMVSHRTMGDMTESQYKPEGLPEEIASVRMLKVIHSVYVDNCFSDLMGICRLLKE